MDNPALNSETITLGPERGVLMMDASQHMQDVLILTGALIVATSPLDVEEFKEKYPLPNKEELLNSGVISEDGAIDIARLKDEFPVDYRYLESHGFLEPTYSLVPEKFEEHAEYLEETIGSNMIEAITKVESGTVLFVTDTTGGLALQENIGGVAVGIYQPIDEELYLGVEKTFIRGELSENFSTYGLGYGRYDLDKNCSVGLNGGIVHNENSDNEGWTYNQSRFSIGVENDCSSSTTAGIATQFNFSNNTNTDFTLSAGYSNHDGAGQYEAGASIARDVVSIATAFKVQVEASYDCVKPDVQDIKCDTNVGAGFTIRF